VDFVGIDIAKRKFDVVWLSSEEKKYSKVFENTPAGHKEFLVWLDKKKIAPGSGHLAMEATSQYYEALAQVLYEAGYTVSVVNPLQIKAFGESLLRRQKTDKADADLIARFCAQNKPMAWQPPPPQVRELQRLLARLEAVQDMHVQEQNRQHEAAGVALESVARMIKSLNDEQELLEKMIRDHIDRHPDLRDKQELLMSIPGIGPRVCSYVMAWLPVERFTDVRQAVAFVGLSPRHRQSGDSVRGKSMLSKLGHGRLRKILYFPAMSAVRHNPAAKVLWERLKAAGKPGKVALVAVMRKLVHWMMGVLRSAAPFDAQLALARI
jgi:transposase